MIILKHSQGVDKPPLLTDLEWGEIAINTVIGRLYMKQTKVVPGYPDEIIIKDLKSESKVKTIKFISDGNTVYDFSEDITFYNIITVNGLIIKDSEFTISDEILTIPSLLVDDYVTMMKRKPSSIFPTNL